MSKTYINVDCDLFLLKSDVLLPDTVLENLTEYKSDQLDKKMQVARYLSQELFGDSLVTVSIQNGIGTFNFLFHIETSDNNYVLKLTCDYPSPVHFDFEIEAQLYKILLQQCEVNLPTLTSSGLYKHCCYLLTEYVNGKSYEQMLSGPTGQKYHMMFKLGQTLAKLHELRVYKFGKITSIDDGKIFCFYNHWNDYLYSQFTKHLLYCKQYDYLSETNYSMSLKIFEDVLDMIELNYACLLHGDLSRQNIFQDFSGEILLLDWEDAVGGDPIFDIAMWGTFIKNDEFLPRFLEGYYENKNIPDDFWLRYACYHYRILLAKTVHRHRFHYYKNDQYPAHTRLLSSFKNMQLQLQEYVS